MKLLICLALAFLPSVAFGIEQVCSPEKIKILRAALPQVTDPTLKAVLEDPDLLFYTKDEMPDAFQRGNTFIAVQPQDRLNGNNEFPWSSPAGVHLSPNVNAFKFIQFPKDADGNLWPIVYVRDVSLNPAFDGGRRKGFVWFFPTGTVLGEVLSMRGPGGEDFTFELRLRIREHDDWDVIVARPFTGSKELANFVKTVAPDWKNNSQLISSISNLETPKELITQRLTDKEDPRHSSAFAFEAREGVDVLPPLPRDVVEAALTSKPFEIVGSSVWRRGTNGVVVFAPTVNQGFNIVPEKYVGGFMGNDRTSCMNCHRTAQMASKRFNPTWEGVIRGSDGIFSFYPVDPKSFGEAPRIRPVFADQGLVVEYDSTAHDSSVYSSLTQLRH